MRRARRLVGLVLAVLLPLGTAAGCNAVIGDASYKCVADTAGACPSGQMCDTTRGVCVDANGPGCDGGCSGDDDGMVETDGTMSGDDATDDGSPAQNDGSPGKDSGHDASDGGDSGPTLPPNGEPCGSDKDCATGICGTSARVGDYAAAGSFCTKACCTSSDCDDGYACIDMGTGGAFCVPGGAIPSTVNRSVPATGGASAGAACSQNSDCHSGACHLVDAGVGVCTDNCCADSDCPGDRCRLSTSRENLNTFSCLSAGSATVEQDGGCSDNDQCTSNFCQSYLNSGADVLCRDRCRDNAACNAGGSGNYCFHETISSGEIVAVCFSHSDNEGTSSTGYSLLLNNGTACGTNSQCKSGICDVGGGGCTDGCGTDKDCTGGMVCRPQTTSTGLLQCVTP